MAETAQQAARRREARAIEAREEELVNPHLDLFPEARRPRAAPATPVDVEKLRERHGEDLGLPKLESELSPFGSPPKAPSAELVDHKAVVHETRKRRLREVPLIRLAERRILLPPPAR